MHSHTPALQLALAAALLILPGCSSEVDEPTSGVRNSIPSAADLALGSSPKFELLSLDPEQPEADEEGHFQRWKVLGTVNVTDSATRSKIVAALRAGVPKYEMPPAACFIPRHGIRVSDREATYDFVICFQCSAVGVYTGDNPPGGFQVKSSPQPVFDEELVRAGVPLARKLSK